MTPQAYSEPSRSSRKSSKKIFTGGKKMLIIALVLMSFIFPTVSAVCDLEASLINQDPYPAVPGDYVKLLFQLKGLEDPSCENIYFELVEEYPISLDPGDDAVIHRAGGTFTKDFESHLTMPYKVRVDPDALNGDTPIEVRYASTSLATSIPATFHSSTFNLNIQDVKSDFEIFVKEYSPSTNVLTFEILNIGETDIEALTIEILPQEGIIVKGASRNIIGSLDSNDFTTADFEAKPSKGNIDLIIYYTDSINVRRFINKTVMFDPEPFEGRNDGKSSNTTTYLIVLVILGSIGYYFYRRHKKKQEKKKLLRS